MRKIIITILLSLMLSITTFAQDKVKLSPLEKRGNDVVNLFNDPKDFDQIFNKGFLDKVPTEQIIQITNKFVNDFGKAVKVQKIEKKDDYSGVISILFDKGFLVNLTLVLEKDGTNLISGMLVTSTEKVTESLQSIVDDLKKLPGKTSLSITKLENNDNKQIISHNADEPFAIGSTFKLYVLGELVRQINAGKRNWSDVVELEHFSLPSGQLQNFEKGSPVTLHTLASMMISISDNTATDQLIRTLGRDKIEEMLKIGGNSKPELTTPFLTTAEMFKLKGLEELEYAKKYVATDEKGKRQILANELAKSSLNDIKLEDFLAKPTYISEIEWFASANDLVRLMNWMRLNSEKSPANKTLGVLAINKALSKDIADKWKYVGYKGGSETGVISMTYLLQSKSSEWFVVTSSWNNVNEETRQELFIPLIQTAVKLLQQQSDKK